MRIVRPGSSASVAGLLNAVETAEPTYVERGATLTGNLPGGFHHLNEGTDLGRGAGTFSHAAEGLRTWQAHRLPGMHVFPADAPVRPGTVVVVTVGTPLIAVAAPCRVLAVVEDPWRFGFAYGTLPGHPEQGEEAFVVRMGDDGMVRFDITAFSRPGDPFTSMMGPLGRKVQSIATKGYLKAMRRLVSPISPS